MKIAFLTMARRSAQGSWSRTLLYMAKALQDHCGDVCYLEPVSSRLEIFGKALNKASRAFLGKKYLYGHSLFLVKRCAAVAARQISGRGFDVIFAASASRATAFLDTRIPIVHLADTTFALMKDYYPRFSNLLCVSVWEASIVARLALRRASLLLYPSEWAARSAINDYRADTAKVHVVPLGANLQDIPPKHAIVKKRKSDRCRLLFLGVDWKRKGGDIAFETLLRLEEHGVQAELIVRGCTPPRGFSHKRMTIIPFDKNAGRERAELPKLLLACDFLLLPTRADCTPIVFSEASAFGVPVITTRTGGVSGAIKDGENGFALPISARGGDYAKLIHAIYHDDRRYAQLVRSSRRAFDERLNWDAWGSAVGKLISETI